MELNIFGIVCMVLCRVLSIIGLIFCVIGLKRAEACGRKSVKTMSIVGIVISAILIFI